MKSLRFVLVAGSFVALAALACATGGSGGLPGGAGSQGDSSAPVDGSGVPVLRHEAGASEASVSHDAGHQVSIDATLDAGSIGPEAAPLDAFVAHDAPVHEDAPLAMDAHHADAPVTGPSDAHGGMDSGPPWGPISVVQSSAESTSCTLGLTSSTQVGTLLVAMEPGAATPPNGSGWTLLASSSDGAQIFIWPDNPGGLQSFTFGSSLFGCDIILTEFAGAPAAVVLNFQKTASAVSNVPSITVTGSTPKAVGELELLYLTAGATQSASVDGWQPLGTDGNTNFGWWQTATTSAPSATAVLSTPTSATIVLANLAD